MLADGIVDLLQGLIHSGIPVSVDTNATTISPQVIEFAKTSSMLSLRVSVDGHDPETHDRTRGLGSLTFSALSSLARAGLRPTVQTVLTRYSVPHLLRIYSMLRDLGVSKWLLYELVRAGAGLTNFQELSVNSEDAVSSLREAASRDKPTIGIFRIRGDSPRSTVLLSETGDLYTVDGGHRRVSGNLLASDARSLWNALPLDLMAHVNKYINIERG